MVNLESYHQRGCVMWCYIPNCLLGERMADEKTTTHALRDVNTRLRKQIIITELQIPYPGNSIPSLLYYTGALYEPWLSKVRIPKTRPPRSRVL